MNVIETTLKASHYCRHCDKFMLPGERALYARGTATLGHPECVNKAVVAKRKREQRTKMLEGGGKAGTYHKRGGRVIRSTNSC